MLRQRVITAVVLLVLILAALVSSERWPFALLTLVLIAAAAREWGRLNQAPGTLPLVMAAAMAVACAAAFWRGWTEQAPPAAWWLAAAVWVFGGGFALSRGPAAWPHLPWAVRCGLGLVGLWAAWLALVHSHTVGINFMLSVFCLVWVADISAYFGGRRFGQRKLAPTISPGKSWEGVWSGVAGVALLALVWIAADRHFAPDSQSLYSHLLLAVGSVGLVLAVVALAGMSVVGDLVESLVKRAAGAKDSGRLLPGHGGVLDRIDALLPVFPIALALTGL
jgi:phosphatidate cytidylyltransferase